MHGHYFISSSWPGDMQLRAPERLSARGCHEQRQETERVCGEGPQDAHSRPGTLRQRTSPTEKVANQSGDFERLFNRREVTGLVNNFELCAVNVGGHKICLSRRDSRILPPDEDQRPTLNPMKLTAHI